MPGGPSEAPPVGPVLVTHAANLAAKEMPDLGTRQDKGDEPGRAQASLASLMTSPPSQSSSWGRDLLGSLDVCHFRVLPKLPLQELLQWG